MKSEDKKYITGWKLLFDEDCFVCRKLSGLIKILDRKRIIELVSFQKFFKDDKLIPYDKLSAQLHILTPHGDILDGAGAVEKVSQIILNSNSFGWIYKLKLWKLTINSLYRITTIFRSKCGTCGN